MADKYQDPRLVHVWHGIRHDLGPHLLSAGEVRREVNLVACDGALRTRPGWVPAAQQTDPLGPSYWPSLIFSFDPRGDETDIDTDLQDPDDEDSDFGDGGWTPSPIPFPDTEPDPATPPVQWNDPDLHDRGPLLRASLPARVYPRVAFPLAFDASQSDYDGADATLAVWLLPPDSMRGHDPELITTGGMVPDITAGWDKGAWTRTVIIRSVDQGYATFYARADGPERPGTEARAALRNPQYQPSLPAAITLKQPFALTLTCRDPDSGATLAGYDGSGTGLSVKAEAWDTAADEWVEVQLSGLGDLAEDWQDGVRTSQVKVDDTLGMTRLRVTVTRPGGADSAETTVTVGLSITVALPTAIETGVPFTLTLTARDLAGNVLTDYDGTGCELRWEGYGGGAWDELESVPTLSNLDPIDVTAGWSEGVWDGEIVVSFNERACSLIRAAAWQVEPGEEWQTGKDQADWDVLQASLAAAIRERQLAYGISLETDPANPANVERLISLSQNYTLAQYQAFVNRIAPAYVEGVYAGGAAVPAMLAGTYADAAGSEAELYGLVVAMLETIPPGLWTRDYSVGSDVLPDARGTGTASSGTALAAKVAADAAWATSGWSPTGSNTTRLESYTRCSCWYGVYTATLTVQHKGALLVNLNNAAPIRRRVRVWKKFVGFYQKESVQGYPIQFDTYTQLAPDTWLPAGQTGETVVPLSLPGSICKPTDWDATGYRKGFYDVAGYLVTVEWEFVYK